MDKFDRIQQLHRIFTSHRLPVPIKTLGERLECTERTVHRLIETMQNILDAPIEYDRSRRGWHYVEDPEYRFELPGLWLTGDELQSLSVLLNLLESLGNGLINEEIAPIEREIHQLLKARGISPGAFADQIRVLPVGNRQMPGRAFNRISEALLKKRRVEIGYTDFKGTKSERVISPQTLVHYRDNWYLDAWCHLREDLRTFSIARISRAERTQPMKNDSFAIGDDTCDNARGNGLATDFNPGTGYINIDILLIKDYHEKSRFRGGYPAVNSPATRRCKAEGRL